MVCKPEYCEMDVWKMIIASFQAAGSSTCGDGGDEGCVTVTTTVGDYSFVFHHGLRGEVGSGSTGARL